ncbi:hypothetical protein Dda_3362 [Drechslerella dactyloides]|uniref:Peptidase S8/S53 domain-containing protein n=1 Tax=Drechslerella dactyloides TaxID=74499 RepID=A0AAD6J1U3_DREDA|nr:hypothetical protein Dda_3362 [Drechslerella dactyloides]
MIMSAATMEPEAAIAIKRASTMNTGRRRASDAAIDACQAARNALEHLFQSSPTSEERKNLLDRLGNGRSDKKNKKKQRDTTALHESLATAFNERGKATDSDADVFKELMNGRDTRFKQPYKLQDLLATGTGSQSVLHIILDPSNYNPDSFDFDRLKPLIRFLLLLCPELPNVIDGEGRPPLFAVLSCAETETDEQEFVLDKETKRRIVRYLCYERSKDNPDGLASQFAIESLGMASSGGEGTAVHLAIENDISLPERVVTQLSSLRAKTEDNMCLEMLDGKGRSCLHIALTSPFSLGKISWAETLARLQPQLLNPTYKAWEGSKETKPTPLQHFTEQRNKDRQERKSMRDRLKEADMLNSKLDSLEDFMKQQCLLNFDNATCKSIMYNRNNVREIYLAFEENDSISWESLKRQSQHYKLDTTLRTVQIPKVRINWGVESRTAHQKAMSWNCFGSTHLYMIFYWLKFRDSLPVKKVFEVVVDDFGDEQTKSHSDKAILECLRGLQVETWDWRRMDIPTEVIYESAGEHVKTLYLYCSGTKAVLEAWADTNGLARLKNGLESVETMNEYVAKFKADLKKTFEEVNKGKRLKVSSEPVKSASRKQPGVASAASKLKEENEQGFEEQDWLKCMDQFADIIELLDKGGTDPVKVALIDDGVKSSYAGLDDCIERGKYWAQPPKPSQRKLMRGYSQNYNTSQGGHGTVMAYFICRVCPKVRLYVAKLDPELRTDSSKNSPFSFPIESIVEASAEQANAYRVQAIEWAVAEKVDIISMSWAIDKKTITENLDDKKRLLIKRLRAAITLAADNNILLFCANPDRGAGSETESYPKHFDTERVFCIGAATQDGTPWAKIDATNNSCDYFLPGVELGFQAETSARQPNEPPGIWKTYNGSSLSCALASGLAAMILHCTQVAGQSAASPQYAKLKSHDGMKKAFNSIKVTRHKWLPVRSVFGQSSLAVGTKEAKTDALRDIVSGFINAACKRAPTGDFDSYQLPA